MKSIGILGGMGPQASAHLLQTLTRDAHKYMTVAGNDNFPEIVLLSVPVPDFINNQENLSTARNMLVARTKLLEQAGSVINGIACNTAHLLFDDLQRSTSVPFLSIPTLVNEIVSERGFQRVGVLATPSTLRSGLYEDAANPWRSSHQTKRCNDNPNRAINNSTSFVGSCQPCRRGSFASNN